MKKWLLILVAMLALLALLAGSGWLWLTRSENGARWALERAAGAVERLDYDRLQGGLASGIVLERIDFRHAGSRISVERLELAARIRLLGGPRVTVHHLRSSGIDVHLPDAPADPERAPSPFDPAALVSPVPIDIEELRMERIRIHSSEDPIEIESIELAGHYGDRIELELLRVAAEQGRIDGSGELRLARPHTGRMDLRAELRVDQDRLQQLDLAVDGRLDALAFEYRAEGPVSASGAGRLRGLPGTPDAELSLTGSLRDWPGLPLLLDDIQLAASGRPDSWQAELSTRVEAEGIPPGQWSLDASGSTHTIEVRQFTADLLDGRIEGRGRIALDDPSGPQAEAELSLSDLDFSSLYPDWPNQGRVGGGLAVSTGQDGIRLERLDLHARPGELQVSGQGLLDPAADRVDLQLDWQQFTWPPVSDASEPLLSSERGSLRLSGRISDWRLQLEALVGTPRLPEARLEARASGSERQARFEQARIVLPESSLQLTGELAWQPDWAAQLDLAFNGFDPGMFVPELPGRIDGELQLRAGRDEGWHARIEVGRLEGRLRGQDLNGSGQVAFVDELPQRADLALSLGDNRLELAADDGSEWQWRLRADALEQLWPGLSGRSEMDGTLVPESGRLILAGTVSEAGWQPYRIEQAAVELDLTWLEQPRAELKLRASQIDLRPWDRVERLELDLEGDCSRHRLTLTASGARGQIDLAGDGALPGCLSSPGHWQGRLERLYLGETIAGDWRLDEPLTIGLKDGETRLGSGCLVTAAAGDAQLCLDSLVMNENGRASARIEQVPMDLLLLPLDPVVSVSSPLSGRIDASWSTAGLTAIEGRLLLDSGALRPLGGERDLLTIDEVRLDFTPTAEAGLLVELLARLEGRTELSGEATIRDLRRPAETRLLADATLDLPDIAAFGHLLPELDRIAGRASGRLRIDGPVTGPAIDGRLALHEGAVVHAPLGLNVEGIELELEGGADRATLTGSARSGDGRLRLDGSGQSVAGGWQGELRVDGERFAFAGSEWLQLAASPRVALELAPDRIRVEGDVRIDRLRAGMPPGAEDRVEPSADVEVLGESDPNGNGAADAGRRLDGRLGIDLGDDARLAAAGLDTRLAGEIELLWNNGRLPRGRGVVRLPQGAYRAYGQNLEIRNGEITLTGHPLDDPRLDIRAVRDIFGDPRVEAAGVHIAGSARNPDIRLYTDPPTSEEKALAYVVTGADFDHAGGQGALNVGFYLLPKLFVSYGVGLFESGNVLSGRYEFSRRWGVRVVSGERDTGVDLSYTVNN